MGDVCWTPNCRNWPNCRNCDRLGKKADIKPQSVAIDQSVAIKNCDRLEVTSNTNLSQFTNLSQKQGYKRSLFLPLSISIAMAIDTRTENSASIHFECKIRYSRYKQNKIIFRKRTFQSIIRRWIYMQGCIYKLVEAGLVKSLWYNPSGVILSRMGPINLGWRNTTMSFIKFCTVFWGLLHGSGDFRK